MGVDLWARLLEEAPTVTVAVFAIWMLVREFKRQLEEREEAGEREREAHREERAQLAVVVERNTEAWREATRTMAEIAMGVTMLVETTENCREGVQEMRVLMAQRPCVREGGEGK
jgi:ABC-type nickel/cobalt efflux system permease component RcnA